jgi:hypothetical protein
VLWIRTLLSVTTLLWIRTSHGLTRAIAFSVIHAASPALITKPNSIQRFLRYLGEPTEAPPRSPARDPPYFRSRAVRRQLGELDPPPSSRQRPGELFGA